MEHSVTRQRIDLHIRPAIDSKLLTTVSAVEVSDTTGDAMKNISPYHKKPLLSTLVKLLTKNDYTMLLPVYCNNEKPIRQHSTVLAGDIGATKTHLALFRWENGEPALVREATYQSHAFPDCYLIVQTFMKGLAKPDVLCFAVAGPVIDGRVKFSNVDWEIDSSRLSEETGCLKVYMINDLEANAYGLSVLHEEETMFVFKPAQVVAGNAAIIAPGTGLGEAGLYYDGQCYYPFATEGGHSDFAPRDEQDAALLFYLQQHFGHVSWERLLCGPGILNIYHFLRDQLSYAEDDFLKEQFNAAGADPSAIISGATGKSRLCDTTMRLFIKYLAFESANLVLKFKATGGLFIGGGIAPKIAPLFKQYDFNGYFLQSGRLNELLKLVPVKIILNSKAALLGAAYYAATRAA